MADLFVNVFVIGLLSGALDLSVPLIFGSIGETFAQRSGIMNLALNGMMIMGALLGFVGVYFTGNVWFGVLCGMMGGIALAALFAFLCISLELNQAIVGVLLSAFAVGVIGFSMVVIFGSNFVPGKASFGPSPIPLLAGIPVIGPILFNRNVFVYIALIAVVVAYYIIYHTSWGLMVKSLGANPKAAHSLGINVNRIRWYATLFDGFMAGLAGAYVVLALVPTFTNTAINAQGWISVALVYFGSWNPVTAAVGALIFTGTQSGILALQTQGIVIPTDVLAMMPYLLVIAMYIVVGRKKRDVPTQLTVPFRRE